MSLDLEPIRGRQIRLMTGYCDDRVAADISSLIAEVERLRKLTSSATEVIRNFPHISEFNPKIHCCKCAACDFLRSVDAV